MELRVHILPGSEVTLQIGYNTLKSIMLEKRYTKYYMWSIAGHHFWTVLFIVYVNELLSSSKIFNPTMFAGDTNFFHKY